jgi:hypothetical protein
LAFNFAFSNDGKKKEKKNAYLSFLSHASVPLVAQIRSTYNNQTHYAIIAYIKKHIK